MSTGELLKNSDMCNIDIILTDDLISMLGCEKESDCLVLCGGAIATERMVNSFSPSFAHLFEDGNIKKMGIIVGNFKDIKVKSEIIEGEYEK